MSTVMRRSDWTSHPRPPQGQLLSPGEVDGLAVHWNGPPVSAAAARGDQGAVADLLEADRRFHTSTRGWSDIAYQWAVDNAGRRWPLRGWDRRSAANGDIGPNQSYGAVLCVIGEGQKPTDAMLQALRDTVADFRSHYPHATRVVTHNDVRPEPTACPGPDLTRAVHTGVLNPTGTTPANTHTPGSTTQEDDVTPQDKEDIADLVVKKLLKADLGKPGGGDTVGIALQSGFANTIAIKEKLGA